MKQLQLLSLFCLFSCGNFAEISAEPLSHNRSEQGSDRQKFCKVEISPKLVKVTKQGIFVTVKGKDIPIKNLFVDKNGRVYTNDLLLEKGYTQSVPCKNGCGFYFGRNCPKCGWPDKEKKK